MGLMKELKQTKKRKRPKQKRADGRNWLEDNNKTTKKRWTRLKEWWERSNDFWERRMEKMEARKKRSCGGESFSLDSTMVAAK